MNLNLGEAIQIATQETVKKSPAVLNHCKLGAVACSK